jgi:hypothetical protein
MPSKFEQEMRFGSIRQIKHDAIIELLDRKFPNNNMRSARVVGNACESFHYVFIVELYTGLEILFKIPANGKKALWTPIDTRNLLSEALTMRYIQKNTKAPIPIVIDYYTDLDNEIGAPYIISDFLRGKPIAQRLFDWQEEGKFKEMM